MTVKQRLFVKKYVENKGNGTKAALDAYDVKNYNTAHSLAIDNLQKPTIQRAIELALERVGLSDESISEMLRDATVSGIGVKATNKDSLRGIDMILKLKGAYPDKKSYQFSYSVKQQLSSLSHEELKKELGIIDHELNELMK